MAKKKNQKKQRTFVSLVLDETGSMGLVTEQTINGYNEYIQKLQLDKEAEYIFTLTQFNSSKIEVVHDAVPVGEVPALNADTYRPASTTPLYDAVGQAIRSAEQSAKKKDNVLIVIMTDGEENASQEYSLEVLNKLIGEKESDGWTFAYIGAVKDAWASAGAMGMKAGNITDYDPLHPDVGIHHLADATQRYARTAGRSGRRGNFWDGG